MTKSTIQDGCLGGINVVDASRVLAGPFCAQMLGDHGANIIKVEGPAGDETRTFGKPVRSGSAAYFESINRNKRGMVLDMGKPEGLEVFWKLLETADVLIENFKASTLRSWGVADPKDVCKRFPRLVHVRITGYGDDGPLGGLPGYDAAVQAHCGLMSLNGEPDKGPLRLGIPVVDLTTGMMSAIAALAALQERVRSGRGQMCDVALYDCGMSVAHPHLANYLWYGAKPALWGNPHPNVVPYDAFATATCPIYVTVANDRQFAKLCQELGVPEMADDPKFRRNLDRVANREELTRRLKDLLSATDGQEFAVRLINNGVPAAPILGLDAVATEPHTAYRNMVLKDGEYYGTGFPAKLTRTPAVLRRKPPALGEHTEELVLEAGYTGERFAELEKLGVFGAPKRT